MSEIINHIIFQNNTVNQNNNFLHAISKLDLLTSIFHTSTDSLKKEIKLHFIEEKKYDDKNIIYANFNYILSNFLNIFNKNEMQFDSKQLKIIKNKNIKKTITDINHNNYSLELNVFLKNMFKIKKIKEYHKIFLKKKILNQIKENQNQHTNNIKKNNQIDKINNLQFSKIKHQSCQKNMHLFTEKMNLIHNSKKTIVSLDLKMNKNNLDLSKIDNRIFTTINNKFELNILNQKEFEPLNIQKIFLKNSDNLIEWKNFINQKILVLIAKNNNQAEIHLKPESLGSINIIVNMKEDHIILQLISQHNTVRMLLNECMPFLSEELNKKGIKLEQYNIFSSFKNYKRNNYKNYSKKYINDINQYQKKINTYEKKVNFIKCERTDWYV